MASCPLTSSNASETVTDVLVVPVVSVVCVVKVETALLDDVNRSLGRFLHGNDLVLVLALLPSLELVVAVAGDTASYLLCCGLIQYKAISLPFVMGKKMFWIDSF